MTTKAKNVESANKLGNVSYAQMCKVNRKLSSECHTLNQVLKQFTGVLSLPCELNGETHTYAEWLKMAGITLNKGNLDYKAVCANWRNKVEDEGVVTFMFYRNVQGYVTDYDTNKDKSVVTWDSKKKKHIGCYKYMACSIARDGWTVDIVLRGLLQSAFPEKVEARIASANKTWGEIKVCGIMQKSTTNKATKGSATATTTAKFVEVDKDQVRF